METNDTMSRDSIIMQSGYKIPFIMIMLHIFLKYGQVYGPEGMHVCSFCRTCFSKANMLKLSYQGTAGATPLPRRISCVNV